MHVDKKSLKVISTAAFSVAILSELIHTVVKQVPWDGYTLVANNISFFLIAVWSFAIASLWSARLEYKPTLVVGVLLLGAHALVLRIGGNRDLVALYAGLFAIAGLASFYSVRVLAYDQSKRPDQGGGPYGN